MSDNIRTKGYWILGIISIVLYILLEFSLYYKGGLWSLDDYQIFLKFLFGVSALISGIVIVKKGSKFGWIIIILGGLLIILTYFLLLAFERFVDSML